MGNTCCGEVEGTFNAAHRQTGHHGLAYQRPVSNRTGKGRGVDGSTSTGQMPNVSTTTTNSKYELNGRGRKSSYNEGENVGGATSTSDNNGNDSVNDTTPLLNKSDQRGKPQGPTPSSSSSSQSSWHQGHTPQSAAEEDEEDEEPLSTSDDSDDGGWSDDEDDGAASLAKDILRTRATKTSSPKGGGSGGGGATAGTTTQREPSDDVLFKKVASPALLSKKGSINRRTKRSSEQQRPADNEPDATQMEHADNVPSPTENNQVHVQASSSSSSSSTQSTNSSTARQPRSADALAARYGALAKHKGVHSVTSRYKSHSTATHYASSTLSAPDLDSVLYCMATAVYLHVSAGHEQDRPKEDDKGKYDLFDENLHSVRQQGESAEVVTDQVPSVKIIYKFLAKIFHTERLPPECAILTLVYIERLIKATGIRLCGHNWKRILLGSLILASKVWEEQAVWNVDFLSVFPSADINDLNRLESFILELLSYNVALRGSEYAKYYFELRELAEKEDKLFPLNPLSENHSAMMEARSKEREKRMKLGKRRIGSLDNITMEKLTQNVVKKQQNE